VRDWTELASDLFPTLQEELTEPNSSLYDFLTSLDQLRTVAQSSRDRELLARIYFFCEWCLVHPDREIWNAAAVGFWEHLFDDWLARFHAIPYLSPRVIADIWPLWEWRLSADQLVEVTQLLARRTETRFEAWQGNLVD
jgi:hypothetical protein